MNLYFPGAAYRTHEPLFPRVTWFKYTEVSITAGPGCADPYTRPLP